MYSQIPMQQQVLFLCDNEACLVVIVQFDVRQRSAYRILFSGGLFILESANYQLRESPEWMFSSEEVGVEIKHPKRRLVRV